MKLVQSFLSNFTSLLMALLLAIFIWYTATRAQDPTRSQFMQIPVSVVGVAENGVLLQPATRETVQVRIEGPESVLRTISPRDFRATADVSNVPFGVDTTANITVDADVDDITLSAPSPEQLSVRVEELVSREIPIEVDVRGSADRGHTQGEPLVEPAVVTISGPASRVEPLDFGLVTVFLNSTRETQVGDHRPIFYDNQGRVVGTSTLDLDTETVQVTIPVEESEGFAEKLITVDWVGNPAPGYRLLNVSVDPPSVLVQGSPLRVNQITRLQTEPIDITGLTETFEQQATLDLPSGVELDQDQPITVRIEIEPILTTAIRERPVELLGLGDGLEATVEPETARVVLFGPLAVLDSLVDEDIRVTLDLIDLEPGTHSIEPTVVLPERGIELRSVQPNRISVTIEEAIDDETQEASRPRSPFTAYINPIRNPFL